MDIQHISRLGRKSGGTLPVQWLLVPLNQREIEAVEALSKQLDISEERVLIQALRMFELIKARGYDKLIWQKEHELMGPKMLPNGSRPESDA